MCVSGIDVDSFYDVAMKFGTIPTV